MVDHQISIPKFRIEHQFTASETLQKLGMQLAFGGQADFSGISTDPMFISTVVHKGFS